MTDVGIASKGDDLLGIELISLATSSTDGDAISDSKLVDAGR